MPRGISKLSMESFTDRNVQGSRSFDWNYNLRVPNTAESYENDIGIKLSYVLQVTVTISYAKNVLIELPFKIIPHVKGQSSYAAVIQSQFRGVRSETTQARTTNIPWSGPVMKAYPTVVQPPEPYTYCRRDSPPSCRRYSNSSVCSY